MLFSTLLFSASLVRLSVAGYALQDDYTPQAWSSMFNFFTAGDPTHGTVNFVDQSAASNSGLFHTDNNKVYMGVDSSSVLTGNAGRNSLRLESKNTYTHGLIILDLDHMPGGICGVWPAFWTVGANWPHTGEIDILEGVNEGNTNAMTLHTGPSCSMNDNNGFTGKLTNSNCDVTSGSNVGCSIQDDNTNTYGTGFNQNGGGVYATEWESNGISVWFWPRGSEPLDVHGNDPNPAGWGTPKSHFSGGCDIDNSFRNHQIVFDTTFCGEWAGAPGVWDQTCAAFHGSSCSAYVQSNPGAFRNAFWSINSLRVYQDLPGSNAQNKAVQVPPAPVNDVPVAVASPPQPADPAPAPAPPAITPPPPPPAQDQPAASSPAPVTALDASFFGSGSQGIPVVKGKRGRKQDKARTGSSKRHLKIHVRDFNRHSHP